MSSTSHPGGNLVNGLPPPSSGAGVLISVLKAVRGVSMRRQGGKQIDGSPLALNKNAGSASARFPGRPCERKIYKECILLLEFVS